jgi:hypothetical protein
MKNNPYIGPRPFERSDRDRFFGRARETRDLLSLIMAERVVLFYAQSGAGKTSLLNTQIVPALEEEGFKVLPVARVGSDLPRGVEAAAVKNIFVFSALLTLAGPQSEISLLQPQTLKSFLASAIDDEHPPVVIFDQFEEVLTTHRDRWEDARGFFEQLRDALQAIPKLGVVLAMREDHVAGLDPFASLLPKRLKTRFRMELLGYDGALEAVRKPAQNAGCAYGTGVAERLVDDLRRIQISADRHSAATGALGPYIEPVQLQVVCSRLWDNLPEREERVITWPEIEQFGNIDRALTDFYESALQHTVQESQVKERQLRRWFGSELITPMKTRGLALRGDKDTSGLPNAAVDVLDRLHIVRAESRAGAYWYELAHDRLVDPIVNSNAAYEQSRTTTLRITAQKWQQSKDAALLYGGSVLVDAVRFTKTHPDDIEDYEHEFVAASLQAERTKARNRIVRLTVIAALSVGMIIMAALAVLAWQSKQEADQQARKAQLAVARTWGAQGKNVATEDPLSGLWLTLLGARQAQQVDPGSTEYETLLQQVEAIFSFGRVAVLGDDRSLVTYQAPDKSMFAIVRDNQVSELYLASDLSHPITVEAGIGTVMFVGNGYFTIYYPQSDTWETRRLSDGELVFLPGFDPARDRLEAVAPSGLYYIASLEALDRSSQFAAEIDFQVRTMADGTPVMTTTSPLSFSPDAESRYVVSNSGELYETASGQPIPLEGMGSIQFIRFGAPDDPYFAAYDGQTVAFYRMSDAQAEYAFNTEGKGGIDLSPRATSGTGYVNHYTPFSSELYRVPDSSPVVPVNDLLATSFSQDPAGTLMALSYKDGRVELLRSADESVVALPKPLQDVVFLLAPNTAYFVANYADGTAELRRVADTSLVTELGGPIVDVLDLRFSPDPADSYLVASLRGTGQAEIWALSETPRRLIQFNVDDLDKFAAMFDWPRRQLWLDVGRGRREVLDLGFLEALQERQSFDSLQQLIDFACTQLLTPDRFDPAAAQSLLGDDSIPALCPGWQ